MMSTRNKSAHQPSSLLQELPTFDLSYLYDDQSHPTEITVFMSDHDEALATHWITIDADTAIPIDEII